MQGAFHLVAVRERHEVFVGRLQAKAEEKAAAMLERFDARVEAVFKQLDSDQSGELSMAEMERTFGEETHDFWTNMDGERKVVSCVYKYNQQCNHIYARPSRIPGHAAEGHGGVCPSACARRRRAGKRGASPGRTKRPAPMFTPPGLR